MSAHRILGLEQVPRFDCSSIKAVRELGSERRETVRSLSSVGVRDLKEADLSTRGPGWTAHGVSVVVPTALPSS